MRVEFEKDDTTETHALASADVRTAVSLVNKTMNPLLLEEWQGAEKRPGVLSAISKRLKLIDEKTKPTVKQTT
jgi:hypothetical protein